jgi:hypothetical protein
MSSTDFRDLQLGFAKAWTDYKITDDEITIQHFEDTSDIEAVNKYLQSFSPQELTDKKSGWRWVARLPLSIDMDLAKKGIYRSKATFNRWKNDPDNRIWALSRDVKLINKGKT